MADYAWAPLLAVLAEDHERLISQDILRGLDTFQGEHTFTASAYYPPFDTTPRNITTWLSEKLTIGAESFDEIALGGAGQNQEAFNPVVVQWDTGSEISFISVCEDSSQGVMAVLMMQLYPTEMALQATVAPGVLNVTYPYGNETSIFSLLVGTFKERRTIAGWDDIPGLDVKVTGNIDGNYSLSYGGQYGGADSVIRDFEFWNFTYTMPPGFEGSPNLVVEMELS